MKKKIGLLIFRRNSEEAQSQITEILMRLNKSDRDAPDISELSDLSHIAARQLALLWPGVAPDSRQSIVAGMIRDSESVDHDYDRALVSVLKAESDPSIRFDILNGLSNSQDVFLLDFLLNTIIAEQSARNRLAAVQILGNFALLAEYGELTEELETTLIELLAEMHASDSDFSVRLEALVSLAYVSGNPSITLMIEQIHETDDNDYLLAAARAMGRQADVRWTGHIIALIGHAEPEIRLEAVKSAGKIGIDLFVLPLIDVIEDDEPEIAVFAIEALGEIGNAEAIHYLRVQSRQGFPELQAAANLALDNSQSIDIAPW